MGSVTLVGLVSLSLLTSFNTSRPMHVIDLVLHQQLAEWGNAISMAKARLRRLMQIDLGLSGWTHSDSFG
jgi:hypothetical protein